MRAKRTRKRIKPRACDVCGRILTDRRSIELGTGPTCRMKYKGGLQAELEKSGQLRLFD